MRSIEQVHQVGELVAAGLNDCEIARRTQIPRRTVTEWRHTRRWAPRPRSAASIGCSRCGAPQHAFHELPAAYSYLLGAYLGDGFRVGVQRRPGQGCSEVYVFSKTLICLFPQHGPGPKHKRSIRLVDWQQAIVEREPEAFLRGLIHSDGCRFINPVRHGHSCDLLGIDWRAMNARNISVARRASVARLDEFVGPKR